MSAGGVAGGKVDESTVVAASCGSWEDGRKGDNDGVFTFAAGEGGGSLRRVISGSMTKWAYC